MKLKSYQKQAIKKLSYFCSEIQKDNISETDILGKNYFSIRENLPYLCFKIPTGGGKTFIASLSLKEIIKNYLQSDFYSIFWLAPSDIIVEQTLKALKNRFHPYREAIEKDFRNVDINVISIKNALKNRFDKKSLNIVVSTIQTFRTSSKDGRRFYVENGNFENNISLFEYLKSEKPVIILDEAHKSNTKLSYESLLNLDPTFILELTATPNMTHQPKIGKYKSNILYSVSADELKNENMINLPIHLKVINNYMQILKYTVEQQKFLENLTQVETEYIRPIALIRAEENRNSSSVTFEKIKEHLINDFNIPENQIAIQTGSKNELTNKNLKDKNCKIRFIITIDKLKEGWDCPFAYILASVSNMNSKVGIEQLLGRILRNPNISKKKSKSLNRSYVFAFSESYQDVVNSISETLINDGFTKNETSQSIIIDSPDSNFQAFDNLFAKESFDEVETNENFNLEEFQNSKLVENFNYNFETKKLTFIKQISKNQIPEAEKLGIKLDFIHKSEIKNRVIKFPKLMFKTLDFEESIIFEDFEINREDFLQNTNFLKLGDIYSTETLIDIENGKVIKNKFEHKKLALEYDFNENNETLLKRLTKNISFEIGLINGLNINFIREFVSLVLINSKIPPHLLVTDEYKTSKLIKNELIRILNIQKKAFFSTQLKSVFTDKENLFEIDCKKYRGFKKEDFDKHLCSKIEKMNKEESLFAQKIDRNSEVEFWLRNGENFSNSFWLQLSSSRKFYPDFLVQYKNGKQAIYEYKGENIETSDDTKNKVLVGKAWANTSDNLEFQLVTKKDLDYF